MTPLLELRGVSKAFGKVVVADDLSYALQMGEVLGVVGPNGAGDKSMGNHIRGKHHS
jgi:branched-chain amino acid transport system ATP-binding protein